MSTEKEQAKEEYRDAYRQFINCDADDTIEYDSRVQALHQAESNLHDLGMTASILQIEYEVIREE